MDTKQGGSDALGVRLIFKGRDTGDTDLLSGDLGGHPLNGHVPGGVSYPGHLAGGKMADGKATTEDTRKYVEIHLGGGGKVGGGFLDDGGIRQVAP